MRLAFVFLLLRMVKQTATRINMMNMINIIIPALPVLEYYYYCDEGLFIYVSSISWGVEPELLFGSRSWRFEFEC